MRLNVGVFVLHVIQTSMWVLVPAALVGGGGLPLAEHWKVYLPAVLLSFAVMVPAVIIAERRGKMKTVFNAAIALLVLVQAGLFAFGQSLVPLALWLTLFFVAFNVLEAILPSWISKIAPPHAKGTALGVYNTLQSAGLFLGGMLGGWIAQHFGSGVVNLACAVAALIWLVLAATMNPPPRRAVPVAG
jgi:predicted MFS family arabinose efflux permease